jgi:hypothetical protein
VGFGDHFDGMSGVEQRGSLLMLAAHRGPGRKAPSILLANYRISRDEVTSGSALVPFGHKAFGDDLAVTLFGEPLY